MQKLFTLLLVVTTTLMTFGQSTLNANTTKSSVLWTGRKITKSHNGEVKIKSGNLIVKNDVLHGGKFVIDMNSMTCEDIKDAEYNGKLLGHLKSDDFFSVDKHPTATINITKVFKIKGKENTYSALANLTIKGITNEIKIPVTLKKNSNGKYIAESKFNIDRSKWDVRFGSDSFFDNLGDKAIKNDIEFAVVIETL